MTLSECIDRYIENSRPYIKELSINSYQKRKKYILRKFADRDIQEITQSVLQDFINDLQNNGFAKNTITGYIGFIVAALKDYKQFGKFRYRTLENDLKEKEIYSLEDVDKIKSYILKKNAKSGSKLAILIALLTGMRISEVVGLKWEDVDLDNGKIFVRRNAKRINGKDYISLPKTESGYRELTIPKELVDYLRLRASDNPSAWEYYVLTNSMSILNTRCISKANERICEILSIKDCGLHAYRHCFATRLLNVSQDFKAISQIMGHSNIGITQQIYNHPTFETKKNIMELALRNKQEDEEKDALKEQVNSLIEQNKALKNLVDELKKDLSKLYFKKECGE